MSFIRAPGTAVAIASGYGATKNMTALSNAAEAVATLEASHGVAAGEIIEITSGWPKADKRVLRAKTVVTNDVTLEGFDTQNLNQYPAGAGTGSVREISGWTPISQLDQDISASGGEQQFRNIRLLSQADEIALPTTRAPIRVTLPVYYDPSLAWLAAVRAARDSATAVAVRMVFPNNSKLFGNAIWGMNDVPTVRDGVLMTDITLAFQSQPIVYAT